MTIAARILGWRGDIHVETSMSNADPVQLLSPRRRQLASFEHAYAVALQIRRQSGVRQFILCTGDPLQPYRTTSRAPARDERVMALVA